MATKATAVVMIGRAGHDWEGDEELPAKNAQQVLIMCTNGEITGLHSEEHSMFLADVEDTEEMLTIRLGKRTMKPARKFMEELEKSGALDGKLDERHKGKDLNFLRWDSIIMSKIWAFVKR